MKIINYKGKEPLIAHFQGKTLWMFPEIIEYLENKKDLGAVPANVQIVTIATHKFTPEYFSSELKKGKNRSAVIMPDILNGGDDLENNIQTYLKIIKSYSRSGGESIVDNRAMLLRQLKNNNIPFINSAANHTGKWKNVMKILYILNALNKVSTEYVLILDSFDTALISDLNDIVTRFKSYNKNVLFGASKNNYPNQLVDKVLGRDLMGEFKYLNAGTCFGKTADIINFYQKAQKKLDELINSNPLDSEQLLIRSAFAEDTENVGFDYKCDIFQTFGGANSVTNEDGGIIIS